MKTTSILKKTFQFGFFTLISRIIAFFREIFLLRFLGTGILSDAFLAAFRLPNLFRQIFAEGALSAAFIPSYVRLSREGKNDLANSTMTVSFLFFEGTVLLLCFLVFMFPHIVLKIVTPGFSETQVAYAIPLLKILFPLLFFISSSALLSGALQAKNHFFAQSFGPVLHNIFYLSTILICLLYHKSPKFLATGILLGGVAIFILHISIYLKYRFKFGPVTEESVFEFKKILKKFLPCLIGIGVVEINLYLDNVVSSFLPAGSYTLVYAATRFMQLPLGVFAVAFSTILLPHFSRISIYAPKRLHFYLLETAKFITWLVVPAMLFLFFTAKPAFSVFLPDISRASEAAGILICFCVGLPFYCLNKILITMFYSIHDTWSPTFASIVSTLTNLTLNIIGLHLFGSLGIATATAIAGVTLTVLCLILLRKRHNFKIYFGNFGLFLSRYILQLATAAILFWIIHYLSMYLFSQIHFLSFLSRGWGYLIFTIPVFAFTMIFMFITRKLYGISLHFLKK
jgi:putative peptidoglycan lipid II flippase